MFAMFHRHLARPKTTLPEFARAAQIILRWLALPARRTAARSLQLLESVPLTAQASVVLLRVDNETFVLGVTPQSVTVLAKGAASADAAAGAVPAREDR